MDLKDRIRAVTDFPKPGIIFRDITPLLAHAESFNYVIEKFAEFSFGVKAEGVVGIESRGFIFGAALSLKMGLPFYPIRKPGKLPFQTNSIEYSLEYGTDRLEIHRDALSRNRNCSKSGGKISHGEGGEYTECHGDSVALRVFSFPSV